MLLKTRSRSNRKQTKYPQYLKNIRQCNCVVCGQQAEAAHLRMSSAKHGKVNGRDDKWVIPLCPYHHRLGPLAQHSMGESQFWEMMLIEPLELARSLWEARDNLTKMRGITNGTEYMDRRTHRKA